MPINASIRRRTTVSSTPSQPDNSLIGNGEWFLGVSLGDHQLPAQKTSQVPGFSWGLYPRSLDIRQPTQKGSPHPVDSEVPSGRDRARCSVLLEPEEIAAASTCRFMLSVQRPVSIKWRVAASRLCCDYQAVYSPDRSAPPPGAGRCAYP